MIHENFTQSDNPIPSCEWAFKHRQNTEVFDANTSSNTSVSSTLIKQSPSPTTAPDWFIAFHSRSHFKNPFRVFDQTFELVFEMVHIVSSAEIRNMSELHLS